MKDKKVLYGALGVLAVALIGIGAFSLNKKPQEEVPTNTSTEIPAEVVVENKVESPAEEIKITEAEAYTAISDFLKVTSAISKRPDKALTRNLGFSDSEFDESKVMKAESDKEGQLFYTGIRFRKFENKILEYMSQSYFNENYLGNDFEEKDGYLYVNDRIEEGVSYTLNKITLVGLENSVYTYEIAGEYITSDDKMPFSATVKLVLGDIDMYVVDAIDFTYNNK